MSNHFTDVMVDIETTGTQPNRSAMIQLAAVKFNLETQEVSNNFFDRSLEIPAWRSWDEDTRTWWNKQPDVLKSIMAKSEDPGLVMRDFADWAIQVGGPNVRFWAKPTTFDYMFVSSYLKDFKQPNPYDFRQATDLNSYLRGLYHANGHSDIDRTGEPALQGVAHDAIYDTLHQIKVLFHHRTKLNNAKSDLPF